MRILQVISYGYVAGGAEKSVLLLKEHLVKRGHQVHIVASDHNKAAQVPHFSDTTFAEIDRPGRSLLVKIILHMWYWPAYRSLRTAIQQFRPDIVHFHTMGQLSPSALFALGNTPGIATVHGPEEYTTSLLEWNLPPHLFMHGAINRAHLTLLGRAYAFYFQYIQRPLYKLAFRRHLKVMVAPSKYMAEVLKKESFKVPVQQLYNGIALPAPQPIKNQARLLYVGRLEHVKGVDVLLQAMPAVIKRYKKVKLHIVGDGKARHTLEQFVQTHALQDHVHFYGWQSAVQLQQQYAQATAVVIPSIWPENLPTVCIEALATGRPVIGTDSGGIPELLQNGRTGRIVPKGNIHALAEAICDVLQWSNAVQTAQVCADSMQNFAINSFVDRVESLYTQVNNENNERKEAVNEYTDRKRLRAPEQG